MLAIPEGARIIVPKLDEMGGEDGFVLARAAEAKSGKGPVCECYRFDRSQTPSGDYKHIVAVDPKSVKIIAKDESNLSRQITNSLDLAAALSVEVLTRLLTNKWRRFFSPIQGT